MDDPRSWAVPRFNESGQVRWQPRLPGDVHLWRGAEGPVWTPGTPSAAEPFLYRSIRRAVRVARRRHRWAQRTRWTPGEETTDG